VRTGESFRLGKKKGDQGGLLWVSRIKVDKKQSGEGLPKGEKKARGVRN